MSLQPLRKGGREQERISCSRECSEPRVPKGPGGSGGSLQRGVGRRSAETVADGHQRSRDRGDVGGALGVLVRLGGGYFRGYQSRDGARRLIDLVDVGLGSGVGSLAFSLLMMSAGTG